MIGIYDLYDLYAIFLMVRAFPKYELNSEVMSKVIGVLENRDKDQLINQFRIALRSISSLDKDQFGFVDTNNIYTYFPPSLDEEHIYKILIECCECLLKAIEEGNEEKIRDLADCLHNLPIMIADKNFTLPRFTVPKRFWKGEVRYYRDKWDKNFLKSYPKNARGRFRNTWRRFFWNTLGRFFHVR